MNDLQRFFKSPGKNCGPGDMLRRFFRFYPGNTRPRRAPTGWLRRGPLLRQSLENLGRFVADYIATLGDGSDQAAENGQPAETQVGAAIVDADLCVAFLQCVFTVVIPDADLAVCSPRYDAEGVFFHGEVPRSKD